MTLKTNITTLALASILGLSLVSPSLSQTATDSDGDGVPDTAEVLLGTDPMVADTDGDGQNDLADADPTFMANPIDTSGAPAPFAIKEALVENNFDYAANKTANDHLELLVTNPGTAPLTGFSIYYAIKDGDSGKTEGTFRELDEKLEGNDPLDFPGYKEKLAKQTRKTGLSDAAIAATGKIEGMPVVAVVPSCS